MTKKQKVRVGVVGVGVLGKHHARLYRQNRDVELVGIYDSNPEMARQALRDYGVDSFPDPETLGEECDALSIAVPSHLHHEVAMPLLKSGKHLLIEKPIAINVDEAGEMVAEAEKRNLVLGVGHVERFNPVMVYLEQLADKARFIEVQRLAPYPPERKGQHRRGTEVSVVLDLMIHDLDLVLHLVNSEVVRIDANGLPALSETEDIVNARIQFANGCVANITASRIAPAVVRHCHVFDTDAYLSLDYGRRKGTLHTKDKENMVIKRDPVPVEDHNALEKELEDFVDCVSNVKTTGANSRTKVSGEHGLAALKLAIDIVETVRSYNKKHDIHFL